MKAKVFGAGVTEARKEGMESVEALLEQRINEWLSNHPKAKIVQVVQSSCVAAASKLIIGGAQLTIFYEED